MGGSSAPPGDIFRKFNKKRKGILDLERRQRFIDIRNQLIQLKNTLDHWDKSPVFSKELAYSFIRQIERLTRPNELHEPDQQRRFELANLIINRIKPLVTELDKYGATSYAFILYNDFYKVFKKAFQKERHKQHIDNNSIDLKNILNRPDMMEEI